MNTDTIISELGGREAAAQLCGLTEEAIKKWRQAGYVPPKHWDAVVRATCGRVSFETLATLKSGAQTEAA